MTTDAAFDSTLENLLNTLTEKTCTSSHLLSSLVGNRKFVVYGSGDGLITLSVFVLQKFGLIPEAILDKKFPAPSTCLGIPAFSPEYYEPPGELTTDGVAIISVGKKQFHQEITESLQRLGFSNIILASDIYEYHLSHAPQEFTTNARKFYADRTPAIKKAHSLIRDDRSKNIFQQSLRFHINQTPVEIDHDKISDQYFPQDIKLHQGPARFINCGAYNGDTVQQLFLHHGRIKALACFEPDGHNFSTLVETLGSESGKYAREIIAFPCGTWECDKQLNFSSGNRINSSISEEGDTVIQCVALDHVLPDFAPTFINMDIEGSEPEAIRGATRLIQRHKPDLAICVYHQPGHLWEILLQLHEIVPEYRFHLRNYTGFPAETVLYATL